MTRVTGKFQITLPKRLVDQFGIKVGDEVELVAAGGAIRIIPANRISRPMRSVEERLRLFDEQMKRADQYAKEKNIPPATDRGWTREELYDRDRDR